MIQLGFGNNVRGYQDFYSYNTKTNVWKPLTGIPDYYMWGNSGAFVLNNKGYVFFSSYFGNYLYQYDSANDKWIKKADLRKMKGTYSFVMDGKAYVCGVVTINTTNGCLEYNPETDTWQEKAPIGFNYLDDAFAFELNNKAYVGGGQYSTMFRNLYRAEGF